MKKIKLNGKLSLNKETIAKLNDDQMSRVIGGDDSITGCATDYTLCAQRTCALCIATLPPIPTCQCS